jgi:hypothetical protein
VAVVFMVERLTGVLLSQIPLCRTCAAHLRDELDRRLSE